MANWLSAGAYRMETNVLELVRKDYPEMTSERLGRLLAEAFNRGLVDKHKLKAGPWSINPQLSTLNSPSRPSREAFLISVNPCPSVVFPSVCFVSCNVPSSRSQ
jgi:hypothetical protein